MAKPIVPQIIRGRLFYQTADVLFPTLAQAATAWSASESHRLGIADEVDQLIVDRLASLAEMRRAGKDQAGFAAACKREAELAARIRKLRAEVASHE
jgi:hypothetical protein